MLAGTVTAAVACSESTSEPASDDPSGVDGGLDDLQEGGLDAATDADEAESEPCTATPCVRRITSGVAFTCALLSDQSVRCWGANAFGALGPATLPDGGFDSSAVPKPKALALPGPVKQISAGSYHACALLVDGSVWCWGYNYRGALGLPPDSVPHPAPTKIDGVPPDVADLVAGAFHNCVRTATGATYCWGDNMSGELGTGSTDAGVMNPPRELLTPAPSALAGAEIAVGQSVTCARASAGDVACVGTNNLGSLGRGSTDTFAHPEPAPVVGLLGPAQRLGVARRAHVHAILADGRVQGWGFNEYGEIGVGTDAGSVPTPMLLPGLADVVQVASGVQLGCALTKTGTVWCWGRNDTGGVGVEPDAGEIFWAPRQVEGLTDVVEISSGFRTTCARIKGGSVKCWGNNAGGALGRNVDGITLPYDPKPEPVQF